jgi:Na+/H+ antiporter NhaD/arsenite permease-like protein
VTRPQRTALLGAVLLACGAIALLTGVLPATDAAALGIRVWPILLFVVAITVVAELATAAGLFELVAGLAARCGGGRAWALWLLVALIAVLSTVFLSLDTTAVLLTPIVVVLARRVGLDPLPFALTTVWLANAGSLLLPVSNLTNLLAEQHLGHIGPAAFAAAAWPAQAAGVLVPLAFIGVLCRRELGRRYAEPGPAHVADARLALTAGIVLVLLIIGLVSGLAVWVPAVAAALVLVAAFALLRPSEVRIELLPWPTVVFVCGLFVAVAALDAAGLTRVLGGLVPEGSGLPPCWVWPRPAARPPTSSTICRPTSRSNRRCTATGPCSRCWSASMRARSSRRGRHSRPCCGTSGSCASASASAGRVSCSLAPWSRPSRSSSR